MRCSSRAAAIAPVARRRENARGHGRAVLLAQVGERAIVEGSTRPSGVVVRLVQFTLGSCLLLATALEPQKGTRTGAASDAGGQHEAPQHRRQQAGAPTVRFLALIGIEVYVSRHDRIRFSCWHGRRHRRDARLCGFPPRRCEPDAGSGPENDYRASTGRAISNPTKYAGGGRPNLTDPRRLEICAPLILTSVLTTMVDLAEYLAVGLDMVDGSIGAKRHSC